MPLATIPLALLVAYVPHFARAVVLLQCRALENIEPRKMRLRELKPEKAALCRRLSAAHLNGLESCVAFAPAVLMAVILRANPMKVTGLALRFIATRVVYNMCYAFGVHDLIALCRSGTWSYSIFLLFKLYRLGLQTVPAKRKRMSKK